MRYFLFFVLFSSISFAGGFTWEILPSGLSQGRSSAEYGSYSSAVSAGSAKLVQDRLLLIEDKIYGLPEYFSTLAKDPVDQVKILYWMENEIIQLFETLSNLSPNEINSSDQALLSYSILRAYRMVRNNAEKLFDDVTRVIDVSLPGPYGGQVRHADVYLSTFRGSLPEGQALTDSDRLTLYQERLNKFLAGGGTQNEFVTLNSEWLSKLGSQTRVEYVELTTGEIRVTTGSGGHILLAKGQPIKSAGQIVFFKNLKAEFSLVIVSNGSGSYKPDLYSAESFSERLQSAFFKNAGIDRSRFVVTKGEPLSAYTAALYLKSRLTPKEIISKEMAELETNVQTSIAKNRIKRSCERFMVANP
jgi:hypothetical protein